MKKKMVSLIGNHLPGGMSPNNGINLDDKAQTYIQVEWRADGIHVQSSASINTQTYVNAGDSHTHVYLNGAPPNDRHVHTSTLYIRT